MNDTRITCIFCRREKEVFNEEHVFPASIGGAYIINNVCKDCNDQLGKKIDSPLSAHNMVLFYRNQFKIGRKGEYYSRQIPNPLKGKFKDEDGNEIRVEFDEEGRIVSRLIPNYEEKILEDGISSLITVTINEEDLNEEKLRERIAKRYNLDFDTLEIVDRKRLTPAPFQVKMDIDTNPFILGAVKIAYEAAINIFPAYIDDPISKVIANILLIANIDEYEKKFYERDASILESLTKRIESIEGLQLEHHALLFTTIPHKGFCCAVRIFNWVYAVCLSENENYIKSDILLINDSKKDLYRILCINKFNALNLSVNIGPFNDILRNKIVSQSQRVFADFRTPDGLLPVFNEQGELFFSDIDHLTQDSEVYYLEHYCKEQQLTLSINLPANKYFIKLLSDNILVPLLFVRYIYK